MHTRILGDMALTNPPGLTLSFDTAAIDRKPSWYFARNLPVPAHQEYDAGKTVATLTDEVTGRSWVLDADEAANMWMKGENAVRAWIAAQG